MNWRLLLVYAFAVLASYGDCATPSDSLLENLHLKVLPDGKVLSQFSFVINWDVETRDNHSHHHTNLFPKSISTITHDAKVEEMHLSFTQGRWRYHAWGLPTHAAPTGVALRAWFRENEPAKVDTAWKQLVYSLGGVFCGSLQYLDNRTTTHPVYSFSPDEHNYSPSSSFGDASPSHHRMRYGALPREAVCTENHTPWLKLLPCRDQSGLGYLMNPLRVYDVHYHSMQIHVQQRSHFLSLNLTLSIVMNPTFENFKLSSLFGRKSNIHACPLAKESRISFSGLDSSIFELSPKNYENIDNTAVYNLKKEPFQNGFDFELKWADRKNIKFTPIPPTLLATRVLTGYGGERGGFKSHITNSMAQELNITYFETVPWFVRTYFHTLQITVDGQNVDVHSLPCARVLPAELRGSPSMLELCLQIPASGKVTISMEFEKEFLHYSEFPPDAHRGFDLPAAIITTKLANNTTARIYTDNLLLSLPTPDFSMLYNVITLTSTVMALFFGSIFNMSIRRLKDTFTGKEFVSDRPLARLLRFVASKLKRFRRAEPTQPPKDTSNNNNNNNNTNNNNNNSDSDNNDDNN